MHSQKRSSQKSFFNYHMLYSMTHRFSKGFVPNHWYTKEYTYHTKENKLK